MVVAVAVKVVTRVKKLFHFEVLALWVANFVIIQDACATHKNKFIKGDVTDTGLLSIAFHVVKFVDVYAIPGVRDNFEEPWTGRSTFLPKD